MPSLNVHPSFMNRKFEMDTDKYINGKLGSWNIYVAVTDIQETTLLKLFLFFHSLWSLRDRKSNGCSILGQVKARNALLAIHFSVYNYWTSKWANEVLILSIYGVHIPMPLAPPLHAIDREWGAWSLLPTARIWSWRPSNATKIHRRLSPVSRNQVAGTVTSLLHFQDQIGNEEPPSNGLALHEGEGRAFSAWRYEKDYLH